METDRTVADRVLATITTGEVAALRARVAELEGALSECITSEGAACFGRQSTNPEWMKGRLFAVSDIARAALAKAAV